MTDKTSLPKLKEFAKSHVMKMVQLFRAQNAFDVEWAATRWLQLFESEIWDQTEKLAMTLHDHAARDGKVYSERIIDRAIEGFKTGRLILVTVGPSRGDDHLWRWFPNGDYKEIISEERASLRKLPNWALYEFVHWMFMWDDLGTDLFLYYHWSVTAMTVRAAMTREKDAQGRVVFNLPPVIIPEDFISVEEFHALFSDLTQHEMKLNFDRSSG